MNVNFRPGDLIGWNPENADNVRTVWFVASLSDRNEDVIILSKDVVLILAIAHEGEDLTIWLLDQAGNARIDDKTVWPGIYNERLDFLSQNVKVISP